MHTRLHRRARIPGRDFAERGATDPKGRRGRAFTLLELIVVIAIIALLSTIAAVATGWVLPESRRKVAVAGMRQILDAAEIHSTRYGSYPESIQDMLDARDEVGRPSPLLRERPRDPWKRDFVYELVDGSPRVTCLGRDGQPGGTGEDADIILPEPTGE